MSIQKNTRAPSALEDLTMCDWDVPTLGEVVTMSEACVLWGKSRNAIKNAILTRKLAGRKAFTGGDWLITVTSLTEVYGKLSSEKDVLSWLKSK